MPNNDSLIIIIFGLISIIIIVWVYGVIGYKIYLKNNNNQLNDIVGKYEASHEEAIKTMNKLVDYVKKYEKKHNL